MDAGGGPTAPGAQPQRGGGAPSLFLMFMIFWVMNQGGGVDPTAQLALRDAIKLKETQLSDYRGWINGTASNFTLDALPPALTAIVADTLPLHPPVSTFWQNTTGFYRGSAIALSIPAPFNSSDLFLNATSPNPTAPNATAPSPELSERVAGEAMFDWRNGTAQAEMSWREREAVGWPGASLVKGSLDMVDAKSEKKVQVELDGLHYHRDGSFFMLGAPQGHESDLRQLPELLPNTTEVRNLSGHAVAAELERRLQRLYHDSLSDSLSSLPSTSTHISNCTFAAFFRLRPLDASLPPHRLREYEREMRAPTGASTIARPPMDLDGVLWSNCGVLWKLGKMEGLPLDTFWDRVTTFALLSTLAHLALVLLLINQMAFTRSVLSVLKVSFVSVIAQTIIDTYSALAHIAFVVADNHTMAMSLVVPGFLAVLLVAAFGMRYALLIYQVQLSEDRSVTAPAAAPPPAPPPAAAPPATDAERPVAPATSTLPGSFPDASPTPAAPPAAAAPNAAAAPPAGAALPAAALPTAGPRLSAGDFGALLYRFYIILICLAVFILELTVMPFLLWLLRATLYSFWVPQIWRNAKRGSRGGLRISYIVGTSAARLVLPVYAYANKNNVLFFEPSRAIWYLVLWVGLQTLMLLGQEYLGPCFFLPHRYRPQGSYSYDYFPILPPPDPEAPEQSYGDCAICMEPILLDSSTKASVERSLSMGVGQGVKKPYMVTPCQHRFHSWCLERWLQQKTICPQCRRPLPPI